MGAINFGECSWIQKGGLLGYPSSTSASATLPWVFVGGQAANLTSVETAIWHGEEGSSRGDQSGLPGEEGRLCLCGRRGDGGVLMGKEEFL